MFASILKLLGCLEQTNKSSKAIKYDTLIEDFKDRPIHNVLTTHIIDTTSDDNLLQTVFDNLINKLPEDFTKEYQTVLGFTKSQQAIYIIWCLEAEVNNGGYNQFYFNSNTQYTSLTPNALKLIGAYKFADLTTRANEVYNKEKAKISKSQNGSVEVFSKSYYNIKIGKFDEEFFDLYKKEDLQKIQVNYIRHHKQEFIDE